MLVALIAHDKPDSLSIRMDNRRDHLAYIQSTHVVQQAGPLLDPAGTMIGSMVILDVDTMEAAQRWADNDPYTRAGLFADAQLVHWNRVIG